MKHNHPNMNSRFPVPFVIYNPNALAAALKERSRSGRTVSGGYVAWPRKKEAGSGEATPGRQPQV